MATCLEVTAFSEVTVFLTDFAYFVRRNYVKATSTESLSIEGICTSNTYTKNAYTGVVFGTHVLTRVVVLKCTYIIIASTCASSTYIETWGANSIGAIKRSGIYSQLSEILELKQYSLVLEARKRASWVQ